METPLKNWLLLKTCWWRGIRSPAVDETNAHNTQWLVNKNLPLGPNNISINIIKLETLTHTYVHNQWWWDDDIPLNHFLILLNVNLRIQTHLTESLSDQVQLVHVGLPRPQRNPRKQLSKHAANRPHVHRGAILSVSHQQLGGPIPASSHVVCVVVTRTSWWHSQKIKMEV